MASSKIVLRDCVSVDNGSDGLRIDAGCSDVEVENFTAFGNGGHGIVIETPFEKWKQIQKDALKLLISQHQKLNITPTEKSVTSNNAIWQVLSGVASIGTIIDLIRTNLMGD